MVLCSHRSHGFLNDNDDDNDNKRAAVMPPLLFLDVNNHQLTDNLSINFLSTNKN